MIMSISDVRTYITTDTSDTVLEAKLQALELLIRKHTNNNFQLRAVRSEADIVDGHIVCKNNILVKSGDTIQISGYIIPDMLCKVEINNNGTLIVDEMLEDFSTVLITKIFYPTDIKQGVINLLSWDINNRSKVGIQSETLSRHSVTYFNMDGDNSMMGYPKSLLGFLQPYKKLRW